ncbi:NAD(P)/FAD-dependent oxidoreductase [Brevibacillus sp. MCWH]|jgi:thioredoxin reductase (NADPH)|uniref:NAD(P)/FAD-dependent oxidoreductase n=1 Tax=Brevibacillus sp. MCWH TaxID=2508871 RepID=UPI000E382AA5|nr:FAD-dependent oxidoreductase [Brevibacillus sp. MCWH]NNV02893.1 FAD-binding protein [Brevibacillus sp. MCWH]REK62744.1 MAG: thioredoxin reductase [Brevibacillus sp.]
MYDVIVIGAGPAGTSAAIYTARGNLKTLVIDKAPGTGALALTHKIANYPGVEGELTGKELLDKMNRQAKSFGAEFLQTTITAVDVEDEVKRIYTAHGTFEAKAVIVATGSKGRNRMLPGEERLLGRGVSTCATCDGAFYQGKHVAVIGDTEEALEEAMALTKFAGKITFIIPRGDLQGVDEMPELPNTEVMFRTRPLEIVGEQKVEGIRIRRPDGAEELLSVDGVFIFLSGSKPGTDFLEDQVPLDEEGYMILDEYMQSAVPGVFGAGEVRKTPVKQAVVAAADGAIAAMAADKYINKRSKIVPQYK